MNETIATAAKVQISENGPYIVSGHLPLSKETIGTNQHGESVEWQQGVEYPSQTQYALCRCGHSASKPFCDGTHAKVGFDGAETKPRAASLISSRPIPCGARQCH